MIVITGAAGFIGSALIASLLEDGYYDIVAVDNFERSDKNKNLENKELSARIERSEFFNWLDENQERVQIIVHIGARTDTTEFNRDLLWELNYDYSVKMFHKCIEYGLPLIYASSAATYGDGENGYSDNHELVESLKPLNPYGESKNEFDKYVLSQAEKPFFWAGLKFFNVYGPNEYHKGRMANVVYHLYRQASERGKVKLFKSHKPEYKDGEQLRDFIYVKDVTSIIQWLMEKRTKVKSGLYNVGTGQARTFLDVAQAVFNSLKKDPKIEFIDTPEDIRDKYQYFTEADMSKLIGQGYSKDFYSLEDGINEYVNDYLLEGRYM